MAHDEPDQHMALARTVEKFLAMRSETAAKRFADAHPELREVNIVADLVRLAGEDPRHATLYLKRAQILCGSEWREGPAIVASVFSCYAALDESPGDAALLAEAVDATRPVVDLGFRPVAHPALLPSLLWVSSLLLVDLYAATGRRRLLDEALKVQRAAVDATPPGSPERAQQVNNLANTLAESYEATGQKAFLEEALTHQRSVVDAMPPGASHRAAPLSNLAARLLDLYKATSQPAYLDEAISAQRSATETADRRSEEYAGQLHNLAMVLSTAYEAEGRHPLLEEAVSLQRQAVVATPIGSPHRPGRLNNLAGHLADLYEANGRRELLDEAVDVQREAVAATPGSSVAYPLHLNSLANHLATLYEVTADFRLLQEAIACQQDALAGTDPDDPGRSGQLNNLALHLAELYLATSDATHLHEAVITARASVGATPESDIEYHRRLNNLAIHLDRLFEATDRRDHIEEAVALQREVVRRVPPRSPERLGYICNLANFLSDLYRSGGQPATLDEAWTLVGGLSLGSPADKVTLARTRAGLARLGGDLERAAQELTIALRTFEHEARDHADPVHRRDLAQQGDGLVGDLIVSHVQNGNLVEAIAVAEGRRVWLPSPDGVAPNPSGDPVAVAWVVAGRWETAVISTVDHTTYASHVVDVTRADMRSAVIAAVNAARDADDDACSRTVEELCTLAGKIVAALPTTDRLLIVPVGLCAALPYLAAPDPRGGHLIDHTTLTLAPSLAWARSVHRSRPHGVSVGIFHPGPSNDPLDVAADRRSFETDVGGGTITDRPTARAVLDLLQTDTPIGHFSCHARYDQFSPMDSSLAVETPLTVRAIIDHGLAPWLVNLSACETAIPDMRAAEQLISFPTAFLLGGAAHVLATLWPVIDDDAIAINRSFYRVLQSGAHPADALRAAVLDLRSDSRSISPTDTGRTGMEPVDAFRWGLFTHHGSPW
jgi:hypothetical protein